MAWAIVIIVLLVVTSKTSRKVDQIRSNGKRNLIPLIIIAILVGLAIGGSK